MNRLFNDSEVFQKERPTKPTAEQLSVFFAKQAKEVKENGWSSSDEEDIIHDLKELHPFNNTGYEMAKMLEGSFYKADYKIDSSFIEWLEFLDSDYRSLNSENVRQWVKAHNPEPKFKDGQKLLIVEPLCPGMKKGMIVYVNYKREEEAMYVIGEYPNIKGGTLLEYERVEKCCVAA